MKSKTYEEFVEKFKPKKTTDDCYTPQWAYDVVSEYVAKKYNLSPAYFIRPFFPGGDFENEEYKPEDVVVDNPPFSILSKILRFYEEHNIRYFLFAPSLTVFSSISGVKNACAIFVDLSLIYENGASVRTGFVTNLEKENMAIADVRLSSALKSAQAIAKNEQKRALPIYKYPMNVLTSSDFNKFANAGVDFTLPRGSGCIISSLDDQRRENKAIFGKGLLITKKAAAEKAAANAAAEKAAAEKAAAEKVYEWKLSAREKEIISRLENGYNEQEERFAEHTAQLSMFVPDQLKL